jgi:hypothetical protein
MFLDGISEGFPSSTFRKGALKYNKEFTAAQTFPDIEAHRHLL